MNMLQNRYIYIKGQLEPPQSEINEILGSNREDQYSDHSFDLVQITYSVPILYLLRLMNCLRARGTCKGPHECQKIAGCLRVHRLCCRPRIKSKPSSERWGLGSRPKKMYGVRLGDGDEYHLMKPTPCR